MGVVKFCVIAAAAAVSMLAAPGAASAEDKPAPKDNPAAATAIEYGKTAPGEKATIFDDGVKPVAPKPNPQGTTYDDGVKPVAPNDQPPPSSPVTMLVHGASVG